VFFFFFFFKIQFLTQLCGFPEMQRVQYNISIRPIPPNSQQYTLPAL